MIPQSCQRPHGSPLDDPISFQHNPGDCHGSPFNPTADEESGDEDMSSPACEESENEDNKDTASFQIGYNHWSAMLGEIPSEDEYTGEIDSSENESAAHDALVKPTLPMLILANDMIENIKTARLEDDLPDEMLARLRSPPREPDALNPITETSIGIFNALVSGSQQMYDAVRHVLSQHHPTPIILDSYHIVK
jgi:hypothetical protein